MISKYGGAFENLSEQRKAEYQTNRKIYHHRRAPDPPAKPGDVPRGWSSDDGREHGTGNGDHSGGSGYLERLASAT